MPAEGRPEEDGEGWQGEMAVGVQRLRLDEYLSCARGGALPTHRQIMS